MQYQSQICVIGNGAIGKATALGFAQAGMSVTLLVPPSPPSPPSVPAGEAASWDVRVYALNQTAHDLLASLRVWDAMDASRIAAVDAMDIKGDGEQAGNLVFDAFAARAGALAWIVEDRNLNAALDAALRFAPGLRVVNGRAARLETGDCGKVHLDDGSVLQAELIIGADGAQSWVRNQCDIGIDYRPYGQRAVVCNFETELPHHGTAFQWFTSADGIIALLPLPGNRTSLVWSAPEHLASVLLQESQGQLAERLNALPGQPLGRLQPVQPEVVKAFPLSLIRAHSLVAPRVALVGDAAHVVHPLAGHGMNLGFGDVAGLLKAVREREAHRDCGDERVLGRYARSRKEDILLMQVATDGLERLFSADLEPLRLVRNLGMNLVNKLPVIKRTLISHALGKR
ncbi:FAD-dependent monooxygenase [Noviherbaspirillum galbum]|uniref:Oxygenase n=1 Tax=Noviherbaspirillum galbum TaxID=2709383 RepID=A0A6B3SKG2_9BURK|nr:FAD-dependent monooxygenase [Noviherbaspirillum galbum]NEX61247.1 oxygenase [Noviherbaspirillum galbum]